MTSETEFISSLRRLAGDPAARGLLDDAAVLDVGGAKLVLTHDMIVEGVHFLASDPPQDVAWKLVAVNLSDLAAKAARPLGVLMGYSLGRREWNDGFLEGLGQALEAFGVPLLGGDTVSAPEGAPKSFGLTAVGKVEGEVPSRSGARVGDDVWVSGSIGDAGAGLAIARGSREGPESLVRRYRAPTPRLAAGAALAPLVSAMMDVSDGLLIEALRIGDASGVSAEIWLHQVPLSQDYVAFAGEERAARLAAVTTGDDYELLFTVPGSLAGDIEALSERHSLQLTRIGSIRGGAGLRLVDADGEVALPARLGYEHG